MRINVHAGHNELPEGIPVPVEKGQLLSHDDIDSVFREVNGNVIYLMIDTA